MHLGSTRVASAKHDRLLDDAKALLKTAIGDFNLKRVSVRADCFEVQRGKNRRTETLESTRQIAKRQAEHFCGVHGAALTQSAPPQWRAGCRATAHVPRTEYDVRGLECGTQRW